MFTIGSFRLCVLTQHNITTHEKLLAVTFGDSDNIAVGDWVVAIGHPRGLDQTVTQGIISAKHRSGVLDPSTYQDCLQTDAAINPGNSGGPLINLDGQVVGVNAAIASQSGGFEGIGFAIPSNMAVHVARTLIDHGKVIRGWLGVSIRNPSPEDVKSMHFKDNKGALVTDVVPDSPAAKAGLKKDDLVTLYKGRKIDGAATLQSSVGDTPVGEKADMTVQRDGKFVNLSVTIGNLEDAMRKIAASLQDHLGVVVRSLTVDEADKYGLGMGRGSQGKRPGKQRCYRFPAPTQAGPLASGLQFVQWSTTRESKRQFMVTRLEDPELTPDLQSHSVDYRGKIESHWLAHFLSNWILPLAIFILLGRFLARRKGKGVGFLDVGKNKARIYAVDPSQKVTFEDVAGVDEAVEEVKEVVSFLKEPDIYTRLGAKLPKGILLINPHERQVVAYHESGHAIVGHLTPGADPVHKVSIIPRGIGALGYTLQTPLEDRFLMSRSELLGKIQGLLGGRAAEELVFGEVSTGASNDLQKVADIVRSMLTVYGMSKHMPNLSLLDLGHQNPAAVKIRRNDQEWWRLPEKPH